MRNDRNKKGVTSTVILFVGYSRRIKTIRRDMEEAIGGASLRILTRCIRNKQKKLIKIRMVQIQKLGSWK